MKAKQIIGPSLKQLDQAHAISQAALDAYHKQEEVRTGQWLCPSGRVHRAYEIAGTQPKERRPDIRLEILRLEAIVAERRHAYQKAVQHYEELCRTANVEPRTLLVEPCTCEGCKMLVAAIAQVMRGGN